MKTPRITKERIQTYLAEGKRFDGRKLEAFRDIEIETNVSKKAEGSARVKIGKTEVIVGIKLGVTTPYPDSPNKGNLMTTAELTPLSSPRISLGRPGFDSVEIGRVIDRGLRESGFIDFSKLVIKEGEKVWNIFVDIYSINDDGNMMDAAGIGAIIALKEAYMPKYDEETEKVLYDEPRTEKLPLTDKMALAVSVHKIGDHLIVDPTKEEEDVSETRITIGSSTSGIASMQKSNEAAVSVEEFGQALDVAEKAWNEVFKKIEKFVK